MKQLPNNFDLEERIADLKKRKLLQKNEKRGIDNRL